MTDRLFRTILHTLNNLTVLILWALNSNIKIRSFCASSFSDVELLSPCYSKCLNKISTSLTKLNFGLVGLRLNIPVMYLLFSKIFYYLFKSYCLAQQSNFFWLYVKELHKDLITSCIVAYIFLFWSEETYCVVLRNLLHNMEILLHAISESTSLD